MLLFLCNPNYKRTNPFKDGLLTEPPPHLPRARCPVSTYLLIQLPERGRSSPPSASSRYTFFSSTAAHRFSWDGNILKHIYTIELNPPKRADWSKPHAVRGRPGGPGGYHTSSLPHYLPPSRSGCLSHQGPSWSFQVEGDTKNTTVINGDSPKHFHKCSSANLYPTCLFTAEQETQKPNVW